MKQFEIPSFYRSPIISKVKARRKLEDPRKQNFQPTVLTFTTVEFIIPRHFGFCYGVENAIEKSYKAITENPNKNIFLLSQMIHNPDVNDDLISNGVRFLQTPEGTQLIPFEQITSDDIVIIPAFGTTLEIEEKLKATGANIASYNTTCPFVEKVWNRSQKLGELDHSIVIHGKNSHEETRATVSHSNRTAPTLVIKDLQEAEWLGQVIKGTLSSDDFYKIFEGKYSAGFDPKRDLKRIGVVNQTTMLASETQAITDYLRAVYIDQFGEEEIRNHMADTRDTLCYATNDNQTSTYALVEAKPDIAIVIGGHNSSNTTHLVEILEQSMPTFFIQGASDILSLEAISSFDIHEKKLQKRAFLPSLNPLRIAITSGASCPDSVVDQVMTKLLMLMKEQKSIEEVLQQAE